MNLKRVLRVALACVSAAATAVASAAYPDKTVRMLVSTTPGSSPDTIARVVAQGLTERWGQTVIVENKGGANGMIAVNAASQAEPDGYTLLLTTGATLSTNPFLYPKTGGGTVLNLVPITQVASTDFVLAANAASSVKTLADFIRKARAEPGKLNVATTAQGSFAYLIADLLKQSGGLDFLTVPYNGGGPTMTAFIGNQTEFIVEVATLVAPQVKAGKAVPLATVGAARSSLMPEIPTVKESGFPKVNVTGWFGLVAPPGTPASIVEQIHAEVAAVLARDDVRARLKSLSATAIGSSPKEFAQTLQQERSEWKTVIKNANIQLD